MTNESPRRGQAGANAATPARGSTMAAIAPAAALLVALATSPAHGRPFDAELREAPVEALKRTYLSCSQAAIDGDLDRAGVMRCSVVYEVLKHRAFDGDFDKLYAWSRRQPMDARASR